MPNRFSGLLAKKAAVFALWKELERELISLPGL